jgi:hypothetical protein
MLTRKQWWALGSNWDGSFYQTVYPQHMYASLEYYNSEHLDLKYKRNRMLVMEKIYEDYPNFGLLKIFKM